RCCTGSTDQSHRLFILFAQTETEEGGTSLIGMDICLHMRMDFRSECKRCGSRARRNDHFIHTFFIQAVYQSEYLNRQCFLMIHASTSRTFIIGVNLTSVSKNSLSDEEPLTMPHPANNVALVFDSSIERRLTTNSESLFS